MTRGYGIGKAGAALVAALMLLPALASSAGAQGIYTGGSSGYDIFYPNCGGAYQTLGGQFGVVGVTSGHAFRHNACFKDEYGWAVGKPIPASVYMNLNEAIGTTAAGNTSGPVACARGDKACQAHNYGWNAAQDAYTYAAGNLPAGAAIPTTWWLDIETANSWSANTALNRADIQGALDYLRGRGFTVGIYSTGSMWKTITGSWQNLLPAWVAGGSSADPSASCGTGFTGGAVYLVQYASGGYDGDYAC